MEIWEHFDYLACYTWPGNGLPWGNRTAGECNQLWPVGYPQPWFALYNWQTVSLVITVLVGSAVALYIAAHLIALVAHLRGE